MARSQRKSLIQIQAFHLSVKNQGSQISPMHLIHLRPSGRGHRTGKTDPAGGPAIAMVFSRRPCSWPRTGHSWEELLWQPITHSTLSQASFRHRHLHLVTVQDEHMHVELHRAAVCRLYEKRMSGKGRRRHYHGPQMQQSSQYTWPAVP